MSDGRSTRDSGDRAGLQRYAWLLPASVREVVAGDLEEVRRSGRTTRVRFVRLVAASVIACWLDTVRRRFPGAIPTRQPSPRGDGVMNTLRHDVAYGLRTMRRAPGFTAAAMLTIALGIGVNTATFGIVNVVLLKPLAYRDPSRVAFVLGWNTETQQMRFNMPVADAIDVGTAVHAFDAVAAYGYWSANLTGGDRPERLQAYRVTPNTFALLGVDAWRGRALTEADGHPDAQDVAVLSYGLWQRRFGGAASAVGGTLTLDGHPYTIVGVMPPRFEFPVFNFKGEVWTALQASAQPGAARASSPSIVAIARLAPGASYRSAQAELDMVMRRLEADHPDTNRSLGAHVIEMRSLGQTQGAPLGIIVMAAVGFVLLLACANVANLLLARAIGRERELAIRAAVGAGRARLARQLLTEHLLLALGGATLGVGVAVWALDALRAVLPDAVLTTMPNVMELGVDRTTLAFAATMTIACAVLFGAAPTVRMSRTDLQSPLKSGGYSGSAGPRHQRLRSALTVAEVAISLILLVAAGLLVRSFNRLQQVDVGFDAHRVVTMTVSLPDYRYGDGKAQQRFFETAVDLVARVPGVASAAFVNVLPFSTYDRGTRFVVEGVPPPEPGREPRAGYRIATTDYFKAMAMPLAAGRPFDSRDRETTDRVAIINRAFARRAFGDQNPVGRRVKLGGGGSAAPWLTIVGVVGDLRHSTITDLPEPEIYRPFAQAPGDMMMLAARVSGDPDALTAPIRAAIAAVDPLQPVYHVTTLARLVDAALMPNVAAMSMMAVFGALALLLATVGVYGVVAYAVSQQTREFGVRVALGASPRDLLTLIFRRGLRLVGSGTVIGIIGALGVTRLMAGALYGVTPVDAPTYVAAAAGMMLIGLVACYLPARHAMRVNPVDVLRGD